MLFKRTKKGFAIVLTLAMLACMIPSVALASNTLDVFSTPTVGDDEVATLGTVSMELNSGRLNGSDEATLSLPNGFQFVTEHNTGDESDADDYYVMNDDEWAAVQANASNYIIGDKDGNYIRIPETYDGNYNALFDYMAAEEDSPFAISQISDYEIQLVVEDDFDEYTDEYGAYFELHFGAIYVESGYEGNVPLEIEESGGGFMATGGKTIAVVKSGMVTTKSTNKPTITEDGTSYSNLVEFRVSETVEGSIDTVKRSLAYKLPSGLLWNGDAEAKIVSGKIMDTSIPGHQYGAGDVLTDYPALNFIEYSSNMREMYLNFDKFQDSTSALRIDIKDGVTVDDSSKVSEGDVTIDATAKGDTDLDNNNFVGLTYGDYGLNAKVTKTTTIIAGQLDQDFGEFDLDESVANSLNNNRTLNLTLPQGCYWTELPTTISSKGHKFEFNGFSDSGRTAKFKVISGSDSKKEASFSFDGMQIVASPNFTGDVVVTLGGSEGVNGEVTLAEVVAPVTLTVSKAVTVGIGKYAQEIGSITVAENAKEVFIDNKDVVLHLPDGVSFSSTPTVKVTAGDLDLDEVNTKTVNDDQDLNIAIDGQSAKASTLTISDVFITVNRTVAEGNIKLQVKGDGVLQCNDVDEVESYLEDLGYIDSNYYYFNGKKGLKLSEGKIFNSVTTAAEDVIAVCTTPADDSSETKSTISTFVIGSTTYTVNDESLTMDAAPYISNGRTMLPVRYVADALGITGPNIIWDVNLKTVTLSKNGVVLQIAVNSDYMTVNGVKVILDEDNPGTVAENKDGRVYLPVREMCEQFGYDISWNAGSQTVTICPQGTDTDALTVAAPAPAVDETVDETVEATDAATSSGTVAE